VTTTEHLEDLRRSLSGQLVTPDEVRWDEARTAWNLAADQHPSAVAFPESAADVQAVVRFARGRGMRVAAQGTGHNAMAIASLENTILLRTARMRAVEIDAGTRRAHAEAGAWWGDLIPPSSEQGLAALAGSSPDVGVVGYSIGGGIGWLARRYGLACNSIRSAELVTADGELVRADADNEVDLFWALRGGGGSFGAVTLLELELFAVESVYAGALFFPLERAGEVLHRWAEWAPGTPEELTSVGRMLRLPPLPDLPDHLRGQSFSLVEAAFLGDETEGAELLRPLRELGPLNDTFATVPPAALAELHMDPPEPVPGLSDHLMLASAPPAAIDALLAAVGPGVDTPLLSVELRHLGGALARPAPGGGALACLDAEYAVFAVGMAMGPEIAQAIEAHAGGVRQALSSWAAARPYLNFAERPTDTETAFPPEDYRRLREIRGEYDPDDLFCANHPVPTG
jgi:FAD/FMN-containing dehydrogenase